MQTVRRNRKVHQGLSAEKVGYFQMRSSAYCLSLVVRGQDIHVPHHLLLSKSASARSQETARRLHG
jgi:hypothetical protein